MTKKIAIPVNESGLLDAHFGHCKFFNLYTCENSEILGEEKLVPPPHEPGVLPRWLAGKGATDIIAGGMGQKAISLFNNNGVNVLVGAPHLNAGKLVALYLKDELKGTANYCNHQANHNCTSH